MEQEFEEKKTFDKLNKVFTTYSQNYKTDRVVARLPTYGVCQIYLSLNIINILLILLEVHLQVKHP